MQFGHEEREAVYGGWACGIAGWQVMSNKYFRLDITKHEIECKKGAIR